MALASMGGMIGAAELEICGYLVIPAQAGTQSFRIRQAANADALGSRLRGNDIEGGKLHRC